MFGFTSHRSVARAFGGTAVGYAEAVDGHALGYAGCGCVYNGSMTGPGQFPLDLGIQQALDGRCTAPAVPSPDAAAQTGGDDGAPEAG